MSRGGERCFLSYLGTSRAWARARSAVASHFFSPSESALLTDLVTEIEGFFNLLYAHLLTLWPIDSPETKSRVSDLLPIITYSTAESATKYRMCVSRLALSLLALCLKFMLFSKVYRTSSTHFRDHPRSVPWFTKCCSSLRAQTTNSRCSRSPAQTSRNGSKSGTSRPRRRALS